MLHNKGSEGPAVLRLVQAVKSGSGLGFQDTKTGMSRDFSAPQKGTGKALFSSLEDAFTEIKF